MRCLSASEDAKALTMLYYLKEIILIDDKTTVLAITNRSTSRAAFFLKIYNDDCDFKKDHCFRLIADKLALISLMLETIRITAATTNTAATIIK